MMPLYCAACAYSTNSATSAKKKRKTQATPTTAVTFAAQRATSPAYVHGPTSQVTGRTVAENLVCVPSLADLAPHQWALADAQPDRGAAPRDITPCAPGAGIWAPVPPSPLAVLRPLEDPVRPCGHVGLKGAYARRALDKPQAHCLFDR